LKIGIENLIMINHFGERNFWRTPEFPLMVAHGRSAVTLPIGIATRRTTWIFFFFFFFFPSEIGKLSFFSMIRAGGNHDAPMLLSAP